MPIPIPAHCAKCPQCGWSRYYPATQDDTVLPSQVAPSSCPKCDYAPLEIKQNCSPTEGLLSLLSGMFGKN